MLGKPLQESDHAILKKPALSYINLSNKQERDGRLDCALALTRNALKDPRYGAIKNIVAANFKRILLLCSSRAKKTVWSIETLYENENNPRTLGANLVDLVGSGPVVSLTTISSRIDRVAQTIKCIAGQTMKPHSINLYISETPYLLDKGISRHNENLLKIADLGVNIYLTSNIGPYRKQYPILQQLRDANASKETVIVTMDDDVLYPPDILAQLVVGSFNEAVVAHRGRELTFYNGQLETYDKYKAPNLNKSLLNIGTGKNGIAYRFKHFPINPAEYIGPWLAPTADDIWCKWVTGIRGIPTIVLEPRAIYDSNFDFLESMPEDKIGLYHSFNCTGTNDDSIMNMEDYFLYLCNRNLSTI